MRKTIVLLLCALVLAMSGCARPQAEEDQLTIVCTTYPIYLFASAVTDGVEGVAVERLDTGSGGCLHDYTLSMTDMKKIEQADVLALNGAELEEFMEDALATSDALVIDCSAGVELLENLSHDHHEDEEDGHDHDHDHGHWDPHYWMDPDNAAIMIDNLREYLVLADAGHAQAYQDNAGRAAQALADCKAEAAQRLAQAQLGETPGLITFHDGFQYFAHAFGLPLLASIEEEAGSEASAKEIVEITDLVREYRLPVIFTEVNGSDATAKAITRETGCGLGQLTMVMDGPDGALSNYTQGILENIQTVIDGFGGEGAAQ